MNPTPDSARPRPRTRWLLLLGLIVAILGVGFLLFAVRLRTLRELRATGPNWSFPARVYSDGLALVPGRPLPAETLMGHLGARGYREVRRRAIEPGTWARTPEGFDIALNGFREVTDPGNAAPPERVRLVIRGGRLHSVERLDDRAARSRGRSARTPAPPRLEPMQIAMIADDDRVWRAWTPLSRIPEPVRNAIVAAEDRRFERHIGIDLRAWLRAVFTNVRAGEVREGGSTITQQLARGLFLGRDRTFGRKLAEVPLAIGLEILLSKPEILEMYLNSVYWGRAGSWNLGGIDAASRWYFDAPVESLGVLEGATLAAIIPAPNAYDPFERPRAVRERRDRVLKIMAETGRLSAARAEALARRPLGLRRGTPPSDRHPSYTGYVRDQLAGMLPPRQITQHGLAVFTHLDLLWQQQAEFGLGRAVAALDGGWPLPGERRAPRLEGAFVALEPGSGAIRAMVGGRTPRAGAFNRAYQARRQTGSAIKPVVYAAALSQWRRFTPATLLSDRPRTWQTDRGPWSPRNDDGNHHGEVTLVKALERSLNVATTDLVDRIGPAEVARVAERFGLGKLKPVMSIGLGSNEATLLDLTRAFAVFGDRGMLHPATAIRGVIDVRGREVREFRGSPVRAASAQGLEPHKPVRAISEPVAALMTGLLTDVVRFGVAYPLRNLYGFTRPTAGKTGTTDDYRDAWFVGFTPDVVAGVWVGYDRPRSLGRLAVDVALPAWAWIVGPMLEGFPATRFASDEGLDWRDLDPWSGRLARLGCPSQPVPFLPGTAPKTYCEPRIFEGPEFEDPWWEPDTISAALIPAGAERRHPRAVPSPLGPVSDATPERAGGNPIRMPILARMPDISPGAPQPPLRPVEVPMPPPETAPPPQPGEPIMPPQPDETPRIPTSPSYPEPDDPEPAREPGHRAA